MWILCQAQDLHEYQALFYQKNNEKMLQQTTVLLFLLLSFEENKAWCFMWILCQEEDLHEISSITSILSEKQWKNIQDCRLLQSWLAL